MTEERAFQTVSELTRSIKNRLESEYPAVAVTGEISNFRPAQSGHWYFTLKDDEATLQCVVFRGSQRQNGEIPGNGAMIDAIGSISVYPPRGSYQLIIRHFRPTGRGTILEMLEERKRRLAEEGLFENRRPIPAVPRSIVIVTSSTGAAIRDIFHVLERRRRRVTVRVIPVPVQGNDAAGRISAAIEYVSLHNLGEIMIVTRGGGSVEDLLPFSDESVVRAIAASTIPVISAVGHETDWSICDFAADLRVPTPSAAAEVVSLPEHEIHQLVADNTDVVVRSYRTSLDRLRNRLDRFNENELRYRFRNFVQPWYQRLDDARRRLTVHMEEIVRSRRYRLEFAAQKIRSSDPAEPLRRGFAIIRRRTDGSIISRANESTIGDRMTAQFADGIITIERTEDE